LLVGAGYKYSYLLTYLLAYLLNVFAVQCPVPTSTFIASYTNTERISTKFARGTDYILSEIIEGTLKGAINNSTRRQTFAAT